MKKVRILGAVLVSAMFGSGMYACTGKSDVPQKVKEAFDKMFPSIKSVKWDKESDSEWEAEFKMNGTEYSANFLEDGTWTETEHEIKQNDVPENVKTALVSDFPGYKIEASEISETTDGMIYEFEIEKGKSEMEVAIDNTGKVVKKEMEKDAEDKD